MELQKLPCAKYAVIVDDVSLTRRTLADPTSPLRSAINEAKTVVAIPSVNVQHIPDAISSYLSSKCGSKAISNLDQGKPYLTRRGWFEIYSKAG